MCFKQDVSIVDDGVNNLHLDLRHALRVPNKVESLTFPLVFVFISLKGNAILPSH